MVNDIDDDLDLSFDMSLFKDYLDDRQRLVTNSGEPKKPKHSFKFTELNGVKTNPHTGLIMNGILDSGNNGIGAVNSFGSFGI